MRLGSYLLPTVLAVILHAVVVVLLAQSWFEHDDPVRKIPRHVQASIVDMKTHKAQQKKASEDKAKQKADIHRAADAEKKRKAEQKKKKLAKEKADKKKAEDKKRQQEIDKKKATEIKKKTDAKKKAEQKRIEDAKLKKAAEKKRKDEAAKKAKAAKAAEAKRKADAKKAEVARKEAEALAAEKSALIRAMEEEEAALVAEEQRASAMSYEAYIVDQVTRNWRRSPSARNGMVVEVTVHLLPSGRVNDRYVTKPSGDSRFDEDALRAIDRVSVFEKLQDLDPVVFDRYFRKRVLRFRPEDLRD